MEKQNQDNTTIASKYIQQHLANERTYLAWIRTSIAIVGIGFLITNFHFTLKDSYRYLEDVIAIVIGVTSVILGIAVILFSTINYLNKQKQIDTQTFRSPNVLIISLSSFVIVTILIISAYFYFSIQG
jgi:putative membrane protein